MKRIRQILGSDRSASLDEGFTLIEVIVALAVFSIIALTVAGAITNSLVITRDSRSRAVAENLASQDLDLDRSVSDIMNVQTKTWTTTVQNTPYTIARKVSWSTSATTSNACGTGSGTLQYKIVKVTVSWPGSGTTNPVVSTTNLAPNSRLNDPTLGTIIVAVTAADGSGASGVSVSIAPASSNPNGAAAVATPAVTDSNGCTYALKVTPGNYTVSINRANGIDYTQATTPVTTPVVVTAGTATSVPFTYDTAATVTLKYASNYSGTATLPTNLDTTFNSTTGGVDLFQLGAKTTATTPSVSLFPFTSGYTYETGAYVAPIVGSSGTVSNTPCVNVDPGAWITQNSSKQVGTSFQAPTSPGGTATINVPMGVVQLPALSGTLSLQATQVNTSANGDPGCSTAVTYSFGSLSGSPVIALPFGTWRITTAALIVVKPSSVKTAGVVNSDSTVTLDPRGVTP
ncbi:type IV pilus modification PilV family protein [Frondihabitans australicus]|uniref:alpha-amylase n=1 Tax=Frondihabitans australicus TaxID=386892 RepID=A0A495IHR9_9MICO|nr:prepilin-type N-terminal cleavage/methylation domain-containing protein [Frondihabitans australicus]RKR75527.1 prepilin-type N-terminal cleavage/methylation domain-containing protein [Frondihabitans australicus]